MTGRNNTISSPGDDDADDGSKRRRRRSRRTSSILLPRIPLTLTGSEAGLVRQVIGLAEEAEAAEAARARRRPRSEFDTWPAPGVGTDVTEYLPAPETRVLEAFIDKQSLAQRTKLVAVMIAGQEEIVMKVANVAWLLSNAGTSAEQAGSYLTSKTHLARYLKEGLRKFESFTRRMSRRERW